MHNNLKCTMKNYGNKTQKTAKSRLMFDAPVNRPRQGRGGARVPPREVEIRQPEVPGLIQARWDAGAVAGGNEFAFQELVPMVVAARQEIARQEPFRDNEDE